MDNNVTTPDIMDALIPQAHPQVMRIPRPADPFILAPQSTGERIDYANLLHAECSGMIAQMQAIGARMWQVAVVIGYQLTCLKAELPHGEYNKLFGSGKRNTCVTFGFTKQSASRYTRLYKACAARYKQLRDGERQDISELMTQPLPQIAEAMAGITDATSLRQAYLDLGVIDAPAGYDAERRTANLLAHRHTDGRPNKEEVVDTQAALDLQRRLNEEELQRIARDLHLFIHNGRHAIIGEEANRTAADVLRAALDALSAMRYS